MAEKIEFRGHEMTGQKKHLIDKACEWLTKHLYDYDHIEGYEVFRDVNSFVKDFRKAMEEYETFSNKKF